MKKYLYTILTLFALTQIKAQLNTDIYLADFLVSENGINCTQPINVTARKGYDNQPFFSNNGKKIYYSANYDKTNDIYCYDIESKKTLSITNTPATSEFSPMETADSKAITAVFVERDSTTQRIWKINLKNRKEKIFSKNNDSIGYYWPIENEWGGSETILLSGKVRKVKSEQEYAVFVLGKVEGTSTLRIINPYRKNAVEKIIDDSIGRCIRQVPGEQVISYVKKKHGECFLKFYDLKTKKIIGGYKMGTSEDYCWSGKNIYMPFGSKIVVVRFDAGYTKPSVYGAFDLYKYGIRNIKRISRFENKIAFVADDK